MHAACVEFESQIVHRVVHLPEAPELAPLDERRSKPLFHRVGGPDACGVASKYDRVTGVVTHSTERLRG